MRIVDQAATGREVESAHTPNPSLKVEIRRGETALFEMEGEWNALLPFAALPFALRDWEWVMAWWRHFGRKCPKTGATGTAITLQVTSGDRTVAILPFVVQEPGWKLWRLRRLRSIGYNGHIEPFGLSEEPLGLLLPEFLEPVAEAVLSTLGGLLEEGVADCFVYRQFVSEVDKPRLRQLAPRLSAVKSKAGPWIVDVPDSWDKFRKSLTKSMRDNLPYYPRLLDRSGHAWSVEIHRDPESLKAPVAQLVELHHSRIHVKGKIRHDAYLTHPYHEEMLLDSHSRLARAGKAAIATLVIDGKVVAAQSFLENESGLVFLYSGFAPEWAKFSPLLVIQSQMIREAISRGLNKLDLLYGDALWQERWQPNQPYRQVYCVAVASRIGSVIRAGFYGLAREASNLRRRMKLHILP